MSEKIFSGKSSVKFWRAVNESKRDILYEYSIKAQEIEQQRDDLLAACKDLSAIAQKIGITDDQPMRDNLASAIVNAEAVISAAKT